MATDEEIKKSDQAARQWTDRVKILTKAKMKMIDVEFLHNASIVQGIKAKDEEIKAIQKATKWATQLGGQEENLARIREVIAQKQHEANEMFAGGALKGVNASNIWGKSVYRDTEGVTRSTSNLHLAMASLVPVNQKHMALLKAMSPETMHLADAQENVGGKMLKMNLAAMSLGAGLGFAGIIMKLLATYAKGVSSTFMGLTGAIGISNVSLNRSKDLYGGAQLATAIYGGSQEDIIKGIQALTGSYALNQTSVNKLVAANKLFDLGSSIGEFIGLSKATGMATDAAFELAGNLVMMGASVAELPDAFARFHVAVQETGLDTGRLAQAIANVSPVSILAADSAGELYEVFKGFRKTFDTNVSDPIIRFARESGRMRMMADAMMSFSEITGKLSIGQILAFGGTGRAGTAPMTALLHGLQSPANVAISMARRIMEGGRGAENQQMALVAMGTQLGLSTEKSVGFAVEMSNTLKTMREAEARHDKQAVDTARRHLETSAALNSMVQDPMAKLVAIAEAILAGLIRIIDRFMGGSTLNMRMAGSMRGSPRTSGIGAGG